jgi:uncharacterized protein
VNVSNSSPLILFQQIGRMDLLEEVLEEIWIPPAVAEEIEPSLGQPPAWIRVTTAPFLATPVEWRVALDRGEREAIALALERSADRVVLDDRQARQEAKRLGLKVVGSVGIVLEAHRLGVIDDVQPDLDAMLEVGFHLSRVVYEQALSIAAMHRTRRDEPLC